MTDFENKSVLYLTNQYPKVSHSFIRRELRAVEALGVTVHRAAFRGWEDDTLVIETTNIHPEQVLMGMSNASFYPSEDTRVIERLTRVSEDQINYEFTIDDPTIFADQIRGEVPFNRLDALLYEYACHEANYALENVLRGARSEEERERNENQQDRR